MSTPIQVLMVEDDIRAATGIQNALLPLGFNFFWCQTLKSAFNVYQEYHKNLDLILLDGYLGSSRFGMDSDNTTIPLIIQVKDDVFRDSSFFTGKMIAMSTSAEMRKQMVRAGCHDECRKSAIVIYLAEMFNRI